MHSHSSTPPLNHQQGVPLPHLPVPQLVEYLVTIELFRDGPESPWGFRLKGGADVDGGTPLEIIKVFVGSASSCLLVPGDKILSINSQNTQDVTHTQAQTMFRTSGTSARLEVARMVKCQPEGAKLAGSQMKEEVQSGQQPFRTSTMVLPAPRTIREVGGGSGYYSYQPPRGPQFCQAKPPAAQPTPLHYSQGIKRDPNSHPGYVQAALPQLPSSKDATLSKPHESETFKIILKAEMVAAKDQSGIDAKKFEKTQHSRPLSQLSDLSEGSRFPVDPVLKNTSINQSTTFKKLMHSVMGETEF
eukprot:GFUD01007519.1.p1 GENE.GFUD01007519.1~~GFUD01007519.1.p1  ORF type:complete len:302 (-),score=78.08 GFUD01007519.1:120-1025(-)